MITKRMMDTAWLEDFLTLIEEKGFARAATRRHVTQPAFSRRIQALEEWLDAPLFDRTARTLQLTPAGETFKSYAEGALRCLSTGRNEAQRAMQAAEQVLSFAATHALSMTFFPTWLRQLEAEAPLAASVQLTADHMVACERIMLEGRAQFLLCHQHVITSSWLETERFISMRIGDDVLVPVSAPKTPGAEQAMFAIGGDALPYLSYTEQSGMGRILAAAWREKGMPVPLKPVFASHVSSVLVAMARSGRGITWAPLSLIQEDMRTGALVRAADSSYDVSLEIRLYRPCAQQSKSAETLWARLQARAAAQAAIEQIAGTH